MLEEIISESWVYQDIKRKGFEEGFKEGLEEGRVKGLEHAIRRKGFKKGVKKGLEKGRVKGLEEALLNIVWALSPMLHREVQVFLESVEDVSVVQRMILHMSEANDMAQARKVLTNERETQELLLQAQARERAATRSPK